MTQGRVRSVPNGAEGGLEAGLGREVATPKRLELEDVGRCEQVDEGCEE